MKKFEHVTIEIEQDSDAMNPRDEFDNLSTFYGPNGSHYLVGGKNDVELDDWQLEDCIKDFKKNGAIVEEFQSNAGTCYAVVERDQLKKEYLDFGYSMRKALYWARHCAKGEIETWLAYCNGEVYGYIIRDRDGNNLDSCWGFYGQDDCEQEAESSAEYHDKEIKAQLETEDLRLKQACGVA